jgi:hypothetical protein
VSRLISDHYGTIVSMLMFINQTCALYWTKPEFQTTPLNFVFVAMTPNCTYDTPFPSLLFDHLKEYYDY